MNAQRTFHDKSNMKPIDLGEFNNMLQVECLPIELAMRNKMDHNLVEKITNRLRTQLNQLIRMNNHDIEVSGSDMSLTAQANDSSYEESSKSPLFGDDDNDNKNNDANNVNTDDIDSYQDGYNPQLLQQTNVNLQKFLPYNNEYGQNYGNFGLGQTTTKRPS